MMSLRIEPLNGCGYSSFSSREMVLRLVPTSFASSSSDNPALLRKIQRNDPKYLIAHFSQIASKDCFNVFRCVPLFLRIAVLFSLFPIIIRVNELLHCSTRVGIVVQ